MMENIYKCKNSKNPLWCETIKTFKVVQDNFLEEHPDHQLLQIINGNNQLSQDGRARHITSMEGKTIAFTVNPDEHISNI